MAAHLKLPACKLVKRKLFIIDKTSLLLQLDRSNCYSVVCKVLSYVHQVAGLNSGSVWKVYLAKNTSLSHTFE